MTRQGIAFPNTAAALGGASRVEYSARFAWIHLPDQAAPVRLPLSKLPPVDQWTAFNLADAAKPAEEPARDLAAELNEAERLLSLANPSDNDEATREWNRYCHAHGISESTRRQMIAAKLERERAELDDAKPATAGRLVSINPAGEITEMIDDDETAGRLADLARELWEAMTPEQRSHIIRARVNERP